MKMNQKISYVAETLRAHSQKNASLHFNYSSYFGRTLLASEQSELLDRLEGDKIITILQRPDAVPEPPETNHHLTWELQIIDNDALKKYSEWRGSKNDPSMSIILTFDKNTSVLCFQGKEIEISKTMDSDPHYLLSILFRDKQKTWACDEIWEDPYFSREREYKSETDWRKIYNAGYSVNEKIAKATMIDDFLDVAKTAVSINKKYLA